MEHVSKIKGYKTSNGFRTRYNNLTVQIIDYEMHILTVVEIGNVRGQNI